MHIYNFEQVVGNFHVVSLLKRMLGNSIFPSFSIYHGNFGTGKSTCAKITAMTLTCDSPIDGNPCGQCPTCRANKKAFETTGESMFVKVVNLGILLNRAEVNNLIKDVFVLQSGDKPRVYIFEEAHVLEKLQGAQTALLEEIDRMPPNTYVIMCTTRKYDIIPELASRAMVFGFSKLNNTQAAILIRKIARVPLSSEVIDLIIKTSDGVPREIIKNVEFIINNDVTLEEYKEYACVINDDYLILLFESMRNKVISDFMSIVNDLCDTRTPNDVLVALKEFTLNLLFTVEGATTALSSNDDFDAKGFTDISTLNKMLATLEKCPRNISEIDLRMLLYRFRLLIQGRTTQGVVREAAQVASVEKERAKVEVLQQKVMGVESEHKALHPLRVDAFRK